MTGAAIRRPVADAAELRKKQRPVVPKIVADAPHVGMGFDVVALIDGRGAGGSGEDDGTAGLVDGFADGFDLGGVVGGGEIVDFDKVQ